MRISSWRSDFLHREASTFNVPRVNCRHFRCAHFYFTSDNLAKLLRQCHCAPRAHQWLPVHCYLNKQKQRPKLQNHAVMTRSRPAATASFRQCPLLTAEGWEMTQTVSLSSWDIQDVLSPYVNLLIQAILHSAAQPPFSVLLLWLCNFKGYNQQAWVLNHNLTPLVSYHRGD